MAAGRIVVPPYFPARNRDFDLLSGAKLYVYENNTTTKADIYLDEAMTVLSPNPVIANSSGQFPAIYAEAGTEAAPVLYSVSVTTSTGASPGNPFNFDNYRPSVDWETAAAALAEAAAVTAVDAATEAAADLASVESIYDDILAIEATGSNAPAIAARALRDGSNLTGSEPTQFRDAIAAVSTVALAATSGASLVGFMQSGTSPTAETVQTAVRNLGVRVEQFGVVGAATAGAAVNYATQIQRAINAAVALKVPLIFAPGLFYRSDTALTHTGPLTISGYGATLYTTAAITLFIPSSDLNIEGLTLQGPYTAYAADSYGIKGGGSINGAGVAPTRKSRMRFTDVTLKNFGSGGAWIEYAEDVIWTAPVVKDCGWHGIIHMSTNDAQVLLPNVDTIYPNPSSGYNAYGIGFGAVQPTNDTVRYPTCSRGQVWGGTVRNIPDWHGLDTHGGIDITFNGTICIDCRRGAVITYSDFNGPLRCVIQNVRTTNNYPLEAVSANGGEKRAEGFWLTGSASYPAVDCALVNCYAYGHGMAFKNYGSSEAYGIYVGPSLRGRVQECSAINCLAGGIYVAAGATDFLIDNPVVDNPYCTVHSGGVIPVTTTAPRYVEFAAAGTDAQSGLITGARMLKTDPTIGTYVGNLGYLVRDGSGTVVRAVDTLMDGVTTPLLNTGTAARFQTDRAVKDTTANRPTLPLPGQLYFDTTLDADGKPIWYTGTAWVDATGAVV